jgi:hypothetical protein
VHQSLAFDKPSAVMFTAGKGGTAEAAAAATADEDEDDDDDCCSERSTTLSEEDSKPLLASAIVLVVHKHMQTIRMHKTACLHSNSDSDGERLCSFRRLVCASCEGSMISDKQKVSFGHPTLTTTKSTSTLIFFCLVVSPFFLSPTFPVFLVLFL